LGPALLHDFLMGLVFFYSGSLILFLGFLVSQSQRPSHFSQSPHLPGSLSLFWIPRRNGPLTSHKNSLHLPISFRSSARWALLYSWRQYFLVICPGKASYHFRLIPAPLRFLLELVPHLPPCFLEHPPPPPSGRFPLGIFRGSPIGSDFCLVVEISPTFLLIRDDPLPNVLHMPLSLASSEITPTITLISPFRVSPSFQESAFCMI